MLLNLSPLLCTLVTLVSADGWHKDLVFEATINSFDSLLLDLRYNKTDRYEKIRNLIAKEAYFAITITDSFINQDYSETHLNELSKLRQIVYQSAANGWQWQFVTNLGKYLAYLSNYYVRDNKAKYTERTKLLGLLFNVTGSHKEKVTKAIKLFLDDFVSSIPMERLKSLLGQCQNNLTIVFMVPIEHQKLNDNFNDFYNAYINRHVEHQFHFCPQANVHIIGNDSTSSIPTWLSPKTIVSNTKPEESLSRLVESLLWNHDIATSIFVVSGYVKEDAGIRKQMALLSQLAYEQNTRINSVLLWDTDVSDQSLYRNDLFRAAVAHPDTSFRVVQSNLYIIALSTGGTNILYDNKYKEALTKVATYLPVNNSSTQQVMFNELIVPKHRHENPFELELPTESYANVFASVYCALTDSKFAHHNVTIHITSKAQKQAELSTKWYVIKVFKGGSQNLNIKVKFTEAKSADCHVFVIGELKQNKTRPFLFFDGRSSRKLRAMRGEMIQPGKSLRFICKGFQTGRSTLNSWEEWSIGKHLLNISTTDVVPSRGDTTMQFVTDDRSGHVFDKPLLPENECRNASVQLSGEVSPVRSNCAYTNYTTCSNKSEIFVESASHTGECANLTGKVKLICRVSYELSLAKEDWQPELSALVCESFTAEVIGGESATKSSFSVVERTDCETPNGDNCDTQKFNLILKREDTTTFDNVVVHQTKVGSRVQLQNNVTEKGFLNITTNCCFDTMEVRTVHESGESQIHYFNAKSVKSDGDSKLHLILGILGAILIVILLICIIVLLVVCWKRREREQDNAEGKTDEETKKEGKKYRKREYKSVPQSDIGKPTQV